MSETLRSILPVEASPNHIELTLGALKDGCVAPGVVAVRDGAEALGAPPAPRPPPGQ